MKRSRQEDVAQKVGLDQSVISRIESGQRLVTVGEFCDLCRAYDLSPSRALMPGFIKSLQRDRDNRSSDKGPTK